MAEAPLLGLRGISKRFGRLAVLRDVDLELLGGQVVGLIGANGAGKTTLLSIIAGVLGATSGSRRFAEFDEGEVDTAQRSRLCLVTHTAQVYERLSALENLELFADLRRSAGLEAAPPMPVLERLGLAYAAQRMAGTFSRGMLQRLALARAMIGKPDLLLLDEPFTALDRPGRALLADVLLEERARGAAILLSSHDFDAVVSVTDRTVLLEGGRIVGEVEREDAIDAYRQGVSALAGQMPERPRGDALTSLEAPRG